VRRTASRHLLQIISWDAFVAIIGDKSGGLRGFGVPKRPFDASATSEPHQLTDIAQILEPYIPLNTPNHTSPAATDGAMQDALFHYTTASGLIGILSSNSLWSTSYYCANDASEHVSGSGLLTPWFREEAFRLKQNKEPKAIALANRGLDIMSYADAHERRITQRALSLLCSYISCFCRASREEDFLHGLLSQWRAYGTDGGYAIQFSRHRLAAAIATSNQNHSFSYELSDVHYTTDSSFAKEVALHKASYLKSFEELVDSVANFDFAKPSIPNPLGPLLSGPLAALLDYMVQTKNPHFFEERECRLSVIDMVAKQDALMPVSYFNRGGLLVPYVVTPSGFFDVASCIDWVVIGPNARPDARFKSISHLLQRLGLNINVRPSRIPFVRD
jgi:hypothetical protein